MKRILGLVISSLLLMSVFTSCDFVDGKVHLDQMTEKADNEKDHGKPDKDKEKEDNANCEHVSSVSATCKTKAFCLDCKDFYGEVNKDIHVGKQIWEGTNTVHKSVYECCGAIAVSEEKHEWMNGACVECGYTCVCVDENRDHACEICNGKVGDHTDKKGDKDHNCDYCNKVICCNDCKKIISECEDADKNHVCDECGKDVGLHADMVNDGDHNCDYCKKSLNNCFDSNRDHSCDECGARMGEHIDAIKDNNHNCEYCGEKLSDCVDLDENGFCDECRGYDSTVDWKPLYRYEEDDGSIVITPEKRNENDEIAEYRLIARDGFELYYNGENRHATVLDVESLDGWTQEPKLYTSEEF